MASAGGEIVVHSSNTVGADVEALVQAAVSVLSNDMQVGIIHFLDTGDKHFSPR